MLVGELDQVRIHELESLGSDVRYRAGEFAATEIGLAVTTTKPKVARAVAMARRLQAECPDVWDGWIAGEINELKAERVSHALLRLVRDDSKRLLNMLVVPVDDEDSGAVGALVEPVRRSGGT